LGVRLAERYQHSGDGASDLAHHARDNVCAQQLLAVGHQGGDDFYRTGSVNISL
jgi:hypothetical protein